MDNQYEQEIDTGEPDKKSRPTKVAVSGFNNVSHAVDLDFDQARFSPRRFLIIIIGGIFLAEVAAMIFIYGFPHLPYYLQTVIDASIMVLLIFPILYFFSFRPLLLHIENHQRLENALRQSEERFALAYRSNPAALSITRVEDGRFIEVNESFLRQSGYARNEVIGHTSDELNLYPHPDELEKLEWLLLKHRTVENFEMTVRVKYGEIRNISVSAEAIELGGEVNILAIASDITERKQAAQKLREAYEDMELRVQDRTVELRIANSELGKEIAVREQAEEGLRAAYGELMRFNNAMVGRELRMIELKKEVNELCGGAGEPPRYPLGFDKGE